MTGRGDKGGAGAPQRIGRAQVRVEDDALLRGFGRYVGDLPAEGEAALVFIRSPVAAGRIAALDVEAARSAPGVLAVLTQADLAREGVGLIQPRMRPPAPEGGDMVAPPYPPLTSDAVRHAGDPVAAVVAETRAQAEDAAELVLLEVEEVRPLTTPEAALAEDARPIWPDRPDNRRFRSDRGDAAAVAEAFAQAAHVVERRLAISRVTAAPMETRGALARWDRESGRHTLRLGTQAPHGVARGLEALLGLSEGAVRVLAEDCGGAFGMKNQIYPEYAVALVAARLTGRPVRWTSTRMESFLSDSQAREQTVDAALALDEDGRFLALRVRAAAALGAYLGPMTAHSPQANVPTMAGVYRLPAMHVVVEGVHTNAQNVAPYRGAGRPEATYVIERMADLAADALGLDRAEIRRRNLIAPDELPWRTPLGWVYDSGDFPTVLETALDAADWAGFETRRAEARARGRLRGIGIANPIEAAGGPAGAPAPEFAAVAVAADGRATIRLGSGEAGMGHRTAFRQILGDRLGLAVEEIDFVAGDTDAVPRGVGSFGSRTTLAAGGVLSRMIDRVIEEARPHAAEALEVSAEDLTFEGGRFVVAGTDRSLPFGELVRRRALELSAETFEAAAEITFPNGCHVCEVEIEPETGRVEPVAYLVVDDVGVVINPLLVHGQIHGGVAQGLGQALMEAIRYDPEDGQLLSASFMDYAMPRARDVPPMSVATHAAPAPGNPLGAKGAGEAGVVGSIAAVMSAVADALRPLGVDHVDMPATAETVWRAIRTAS